MTAIENARKGRKLFLKLILFTEKNQQALFYEKLCYPWNLNMGFVNNNNNKNPARRKKSLNITRSYINTVVVPSQRLIYNLYLKNISKTIIWTFGKSTLHITSSCLPANSNAKIDLKLREVDGVLSWFGTVPCSLAQKWKKGTSPPTTFC